MANSILSRREFRPPCDMKFGCRSEEVFAEDDYYSNLRTNMSDFYDRFRNKIERASERRKNQWSKMAQKRKKKPYHPYFTR